MPIDFGPNIFAPALSSFEDWLKYSQGRDAAAEAAGVAAIGPGYGQFAQQQSGRATQERNRAADEALRAKTIQAYGAFGPTEAQPPEDIYSPEAINVRARMSAIDMGTDRTLMEAQKRAGISSAEALAEERNAQTENIREMRTTKERLLNAQAALAEARASGDMTAYQKAQLEISRLSASQRGNQVYTVRADKSYQFNSARLERERKPLIDQATRFDRLIETVDQRTPQADALIAPELLTVIAGGLGSGMRMNEAELSRIIGGRTQWEGLKAAANRWNLDPSKGLSITDAQREQIKMLLGAVGAKSRERLDAIDTAEQGLMNTQDPMEHRRIMSTLHSGQGGFTAPSPSGFAAPGASGASDATGPPHISGDDAEYEALPSGTQFIGPDGQLRIKP